MSLRTDPSRTCVSLRADPNRTCDVVWRGAGDVTVAYSDTDKGISAATGGGITVSCFVKESCDYIDLAETR